MRARVVQAALGVLLGLAGTGLAAQDYSQVIAFLEDHGQPMVRVAFALQGDQWVSFCPPGTDLNSPADCRSQAVAGSESWTAVFHGKRVGEIGTSPYSPQLYSEVGLYQAQPKGRLPRLGSPSRDFAGWKNKAVYRPVVLLQKAQFADAEPWSPTRVTEAERKLLWPFFQKSVGKATGCKAGAGGDVVEIKYQESDLEVVSVLSAKDGSRLIEAELRPALNRCDGPRSAEWSTFWFYLSRDAQVTPLVAETRDTDSDRTLTFLDAGDYDGDGQAEAIFWLSGYDEDGYVLYYDHFSKHVEFTWFYH